MNIFVKQMIGCFKELKQCIFVGMLFYSFMMSAGLFSYYCYSSHGLEGICKRDHIRYINYLCNILLGSFGSTLIWTAQYEFIDRISLKAEKKKLFSYFYSVLELSGIFGNGFNIIYYSFDLSIMTYFTVFLICLISVSFSLLFILPDIRNYNPELDVVKQPEI